MNTFELYASINLNSDEYKKSLQDAESATDQTASNLDAKAVAIGTVVASMIQKGAEIFANVAKAGIEYNAQIETYLTMLTTALGNEAAAAAAIEQIKKDAASTPYSVDGLVKANSYLIAAGENAESARATILALTDAVSATGGGNTELMRMAQNLQQIKNTGKATAMDIRQFAMAGIDMYGLLADYTGETVAAVQEMDISYEMVAGALQKAAAEGGKFYGANIAQSQTLNGQISTLKDNIAQQLGNAFKGVSNTLSGDVLPAINKFISGLNVGEVVSGFKGLVAVIGTVGGAIAAQLVADKIAAWWAEIANASMSFSVLTAGMDAATIANMALTGQLTIGQTVIGVLAGKISLATAAQAGWNAVTSAFPVAIIVAALAAIGFAVADYVNDINSAKINTDDLRSSLEGLVPPETVNEAGELADQINKLQDQLRYANEQLTTDQLYGFTNDVDQAQQRVDELNAELERLTGELNNIKSKAGLIPPEATAMSASLGLVGEAATDMGNSIKKAGEFSADMIGKFKKWEADYAETYNKISKSVSGWFGLFDEAKVNVETNINDMMAAMQSQIDFNANYSKNLDTLASYDIPNLAQAFQSMGPEGAAFAQAIVDAIDEAGGATSEGGQQIIADLNALATGISESQADLSESLTNVTGDFESAFSDLVATAEQGANDLDQSSLAAAAGAATVQAYIASILAGKDGAAGAAAEVAAAAGAGFNTGGPSLPRRGGGAGGPTFMPLAVGSDYIPYDDFPALLHKGEMVLPAKASDELRDFLQVPSSSVGGSGGSLTEIVVLLQQILQKNPALYLDGVRVSKALAEDTDTALGEINSWKGRGLSMA